MEVKRKFREFLPNDFVLDTWEDISDYLTRLIDFQINTKEDFILWLKNRSELDAFLEENLAWRYIKMTIDTSDEKLSKSYQYFVTEIQPKLAPLDDQLNKKNVGLSIHE